MTNPASALAGPFPCSTPHNASLQVDVAFDGSAVRAAIVETDHDVVEAFQHMTKAQRARFIENGWSIGLRAALNAHRLADEARLDDVGRELMATFREEWLRHQEAQQAALGSALSDYFDPKDGRVPLRIDQFLRDGGELTRAMDKYLAPEGELAKVIARSFSETSPLMKRLSVTDSTGVVQVIEANVRSALDKHQAAFSLALDPTTKNGALARFFSKLKEDLKAASEDRDKQLAIVTKALDATDKTSAMSRFYGEMRAAQDKLLRSMNAEDPASPLGAIKSTLTGLLERHAKAQADALATIAERQRKDSLEMRDTLARFDERRRGEARSAAGGMTFEDAVTAALVALVRGSAVTLEATGNSVGHHNNCKVGDHVLTFGDESKFAGSALVVEAKRDASYSVPKALAELQKARANRAATAGLFVMARSHAPTDFPRFNRYGVDTIIVWDDQDPDGDVVLELGVSLGLFIAPQMQRAKDEQADMAAIHDLEGRIETEIKRYDRIRRIADGLRNDADKLGEEARKGEKFLNIMLGKARETLRAMDVPLLEEHQSAQQTLALPALQSCSDAAE